MKETVKEIATKDQSEDKNGDQEDPILEMIDLTEDLEERKDARRAEDKIKDKLAAAAREKLALVAKDRALQMERRKKAAAFLKLKAVQPEKAKDRRLDDDKVLVVSDSENKVEKVEGKRKRRSRSRTKEKKGKKEESEPEIGRAHV